MKALPLIIGSADSSLDGTDIETKLHDGLEINRPRLELKQRVLPELRKSTLDLKTELTTLCCST
jgi:hypothetical protein